MNLTLGAVGEVIGAAVPPAAAGTAVTGYSIDSRTLRPGNLFFALKGPNFDGHDFVGAALAAGAAGAVVEHDAERDGEGRPLMRVAATLAALETLAAAVRRRWGRPLVAVTGSAGKTSTKDMIAAVLATRLRVLRSEGNLNNQYGLPLSLLRLEPEHEAGVVELGMSHAGEIAALARIAQPDTGVVTCVAPVHLEFFAGLEGIAAAKRELIEALPAGGAAVLNADDPFVSRFADGRALRTLTFGLEPGADFWAEAIAEDGLRGTRFAARWGDGAVNAALPLIGRHNILNALAAMAVGHLFGVHPRDAAAALADFQPAKMRGEILEVNGAVVVNDCYNSNPRALQFMLEALRRTPALGRRIAVLGEMRELGPASADLHRQAGREIAATADHLIAVAGNARYFLEGAAASGLDPACTAFFDSADQAGAYVASMVHPGDVVLFKASRGVKLENALERLKIADCRLQNEKTTA